MKRVICAKCGPPGAIYVVSYRRGFSTGWGTELGRVLCCAGVLTVLVSVVVAEWS